MSWKHTEETKRKITANRVTARGEKHGQSVLTDTNALMIVYLRENRKLSMLRISEIIGVSEGTVKAVLYGWTWSHVTGIQGKPRKRKVKCEV